MAPSNYARLEAGRHVPSTKTLARVAEAFGVALAELVVKRRAPES
jgi:transcriptional regulator with XRE-family HTH domain